MSLDPQARKLIEDAEAAGVPPTYTMTVEQARRANLEKAAATSGPPEPLARVEDRWIPGAGGEIRLRVYTPVGEGPLPGLVYFHGGGWVVGDLDTHDSLCRSLANAAGCVLVSVDYRRAPEHRFPAAPQDAYDATRWVWENAAELAIDPGRVAVGGDSAGGNLATVTCLMARDRVLPPLRFQLLFYPCTDCGCDTASYQEFATGYSLLRADMIWFLDHYLGNEADRLHPHASPLRAPSLEGLPPALVITAGYDPLRDEGEAYAERLRASGVPVTLSRYDGMIHGFVRMAGVLDQGKAAIAEAGAALREALLPG